ncbi:hypothetical protein HRI_000861900 [Hibiscus trionum]|uniref:FAF domain-containing protein n=1 Tax=Hibiscus trionum TaxID=183268 RepID=A0A9W7H6Y2_HIBTR|nr:hypothetical protein HRI_000861900 [Hibiscus trionum]
MATIVYHHQGLQSCLELQSVEPRTLRLTLSSSRPHSAPPPHELVTESSPHHSNPEPGGWTLLQALFDGPRLSNETTYVLPLFKPSFSALSDKSLELCTENLGSETGSDDFLNDDDDIFSLSSSSNPQSRDPPTWKQHKSLRVSDGKKAIGGDFPPPLTTISGTESVRLLPYRENGRLVITAEKGLYNNSIFQTERSNGRLRLCILKEEDEENGNNEEEAFEDDSSTIAEEEEMGTTKLEMRGSRGGGGRCKGGEHEEQRMVKSGGFLSGYIHSFVLGLPV